MLTGKILSDYAELVVKIGVNLQKGQGLEIVCPVEKREVAKALTIAGYNAGAKIVRIRWEDEEINKLNYTYADTDALTEVPKWLVASRNYLVEEGFCYIAVSADDPSAFKDIPADKIAAAEKFSPLVSGEEVQKEFGLDPSRPILSYVSRMDADRALVARQLIEIAPRLERQVPGVQLLIAGGGNVFGELSEKANQINQKMGRTCITMTGPRTDINQIVAAGHVFVGVSRAALEAMAAGKPVIVAGNEGYHGLFGPEKLEEAQAGNFCCRGLPMSEPENLLKDVTAALNLSESEKQQVGEYGRQVIFDYYSVRRMAGDCLAMYRKVCRPKQSVLVCGYYGFSNAGDDAILESIKQSVEQISDEIELTVLSNDPQLTQRQHDLKAVNRFRVDQVVSALRKSDLLLFGGGSLIQDTTSTRSLLYYLAIIHLAKRMRKPVMLYANGIGPVHKTENRARVKRAVEKAALVTLRDHDSAQELREMGVKQPELQVTADPVFRFELDKAQNSRELLKDCGIPESSAFVAVSVREWSRAQKFPELLAQLCDYLREKHGLEVLFLLMQPENDLAVTQRVRKAMKQPSYLLEGYRAPGELMGVLGKAKLCLAMRLHTLIFAAKMAVPTMGLVYDPKVESYLKELEQPAAGNVEQFDVAQAMACADEVMKEYDVRLEKLKIKSEELTQSARENERALLNLLKQVKEN